MTQRKGVGKGERLLTPKQACERLGIVYTTLYKMIKTGKIRAVRLESGRLRIPESELEKVIKG